MIKIERNLNVGAYTVHLNMQEYVWDGIKRDRLVWIGDMHPETSTIQAVLDTMSLYQRVLTWQEMKLPCPIHEWYFFIFFVVGSDSPWLVHAEWR